LFHFLIDQAARHLIGHAQRKIAHRHFFSRAFSHQSMAKASKSFAGGNLPDSPHPQISIPKSLQNLASTFVALQEKRHLADYDLSTPFFRSDVLTLIERTENAFSQWREVRDDEAASLYLIDLLVRREISNR